MATRKSNGEGSLYYSNSLERWVIQYTEPGTKTKKKIVQKKDEPEKEFKKRYYNLISSINTNKYATSSRITLQEIIKEQIEGLYMANNIKPTSYLRKKATFNIIKQLPFSSKPIQSISNFQINHDLLKIASYSNSYISKICGMISSAYDYAMVNNIINVNPFKIKGAIIKPKSIKETKKIEALTIDEQKNFLNELDDCTDKYKNIFYILIYTGMRVGEALALKNEDIDLKNKTIKINRTLTKNEEDKVTLGDTTKTYSGMREVPIINKLFPVIENLTTTSGYLFLDNKKLIDPALINAHFKKICKDANIQVIINTNKTKKDKEGNKIKVNLRTSTVNTHMLRHTFATRCIEAGMSAVALSKILGHKDIETTLNTYTSVFNKFQKSELEKVEEYLNKL